MKQPLPLFLLLCLFGMACKKNSRDTTNSNEIRANGLYAQWRWVRTDWTFTVSSGTAYPPAVTSTVLQLNTNSTFSLVQNGKTLADSAYQLTTNCPGGNCDTLITFQNQYAQDANQGLYWVVGRYLVNLRGDSLVLTSDPTVITPAGAGSVQWFIPN